MHIISKEMLVNIASQQNCQQKHNAQQWRNQSSSSSNDSKIKLVNLMYSSKGEIQRLFTAVEENTDPFYVIQVF